MKKTDDRALAFLVSISDEIAKLRNDVRAIQTGLIRVGAIIPKKAESVKAMATWNPPILKRLGDIVTIIAQSNPESAKALQEVGLDTATDPATDAEVDVKADQNQADGVNRTDGNDPSGKDNVRNTWDWFSGDNDPNFRDADFNPRDVADARDPEPPDTRDDDDHVDFGAPDTARDSENPT